MTEPNAQDGPLGGFGIRLQRAMETWHIRHGRRRRISQRELGEWVGETLGREPFDASTVYRWLEGAEPPLATIAALGAVLDVSAGWLAFEEGQGPDDPTFTQYEPQPRPNPPGGNPREG